MAFLDSRYFLFPTVIQVVIISCSSTAFLPLTRRCFEVAAKTRARWCKVKVIQTETEQTFSDALQIVCLLVAASIVVAVIMFGVVFDNIWSIKRQELRGRYRNNGA